MRFSNLYIYLFNPLNVESNLICHLLALLGARHILHVGRIRVKSASWSVSCFEKCDHYGRKAGEEA